MHKGIPVNIYLHGVWIWKRDIVLCLSLSLSLSRAFQQEILCNQMIFDLRPEAEAKFNDSWKCNRATTCLLEFYLKELWSGKHSLKSNLLFKVLPLLDGQWNLRSESKPYLELPEMEGHFEKLSLPWEMVVGKRSSPFGMAFLWFRYKLFWKP